MNRRKLMKEASLKDIFSEPFVWKNKIVVNLSFEKEYTIEVLVNEFNELNRIKFLALDTVDDKLKFWSEELNIDYCFWSFVNHELADPFGIKVDTKEDHYHINSHMITRFSEIMSEVTLGVHGNKALPIISLNKTIQSFTSRSKYAPDYEELIKVEMDDIERFVNQPKPLTAKHHFTQIRQRAEVVTYLSFNYYKKNGELLLPETSGWDVPYLAYFYNGMVYAQYHNYLSELLDNERKVRKRKKDTPIKVQLALLDILGVLKPLQHKNYDTKLSKVLAILLNSSSHSIRNALSDDLVGGFVTSDDKSNKIHLENLLKALQDLNDQSYYESLSNEIDKKNLGKL